MQTAGFVGATAVIKEMRAGILLITSNIGSLFGEKQGIRNYWLDQISKEVAHFRPSFLALHVQESGGKNYKQHSREMPGLVEELHRRLLKSGYIVSHCFLDIQHEVVEEFTALSSLFFVHESAADQVWQYNFRQRKFIPVFDGQQQQEEGGGIAACKQLILTSGLVRSGYVKKEKFSRDFWPTFRFGRKGFLYTRWKIANNTFDLINVHLFHDESNLNFLENPMHYCNNRRNALNYVLHKFEKFNGGTIEGSSNLFIFGDFNFRLNLAKLVKKLTMQTSECREVLLNSASGSRARGGVVHSAPSVSDSSVGGEDFESSEDSALSSSLSQPSRSPTAEPSASSSETDELRTSCDDFDDGIAEDLAASMTRRKNSIIEYYKPLVREYLSPFDGTAGNVSWVLRIGRKRFEYHDAGWLLRDWKSYKEDDHEPSAFPLNELEPNFPPTYPWSEESSCHQLMTTRAPAWCDRILFNENARRELIYRRQPSLSNGPQQQQQQQHVYRSFGMDDCIGDHKPVLLYFTLPSSSA